MTTAEQYASYVAQFPCVGCKRPCAHLTGHGMRVAAVCDGCNGALASTDRLPALSSKETRLVVAEAQVTYLVGWAQMNPEACAA